MENCVFCNRENIKDDILHETDNFFVKVGFGLIAPGHVMIVTKQHFQCFAELDDKLWAEYDDLKNKLKKLVTVKFSEPFFEEHGVWRQSVAHAHIHCIPKEGDGYKIKSIRQEMFSGLPLRKVNFFQLKEMYEQEKGYIMFDENGMYAVGAYHLNEISSVLDYRTFFTLKGLTGVKSWQNMSQEDKIKDEKRRKITKNLLILNKGE